jgi:hypothetical protein
MRLRIWFPKAVVYYTATVVYEKETDLPIRICFVCNGISSVWEVTDGTEVRFCKKPLNVRCSLCDGSSNSDVYR